MALIDVIKFDAVSDEELVQKYQILNCSNSGGGQAVYGK